MRLSARTTGSNKVEISPSRQSQQQRRVGFLEGRLESTTETISLAFPFANTSRRAGTVLMQGPIMAARRGAVCG
jgi:hypothetical protein